MNNRFGRCDSFTFVTIENNKILEVKFVANDAQGPNAMSSLSALNLKIYQAMSYAEPVVDYVPESVASQVINKIYT